MNQTTKTILIVAGVAVAGYLAYKYIITNKAANHTQPVTTPTQPGGQGAAGTTVNGIAGDASSIIKAGTSIWGDIGNLFGGNNSNEVGG